MKPDGLPSYDRDQCYARYLIAEAEYIVARDRYHTTGADYLQFITAKGAVERAGADYLYAIRCAYENKE